MTPDYNVYYSLISLDSMDYKLYLPFICICIEYKVQSGCGLTYIYIIMHILDEIFKGPSLQRRRGRQIQTVHCNVQPPETGGSVFVRWGRTVCPEGTDFLYQGRTATNKYNIGGGTSDYLCLPSNPQYCSSDTSSSLYSQLYGVEYESLGGSSSPLYHVVHAQMPCAVCHTPNPAMFTYPASCSCPRSWTTEYTGYLMAEYKTEYGGRTGKSTICVDGAAEGYGSRDDDNPAVAYLMKATCEFLPCPPYDAGKALSCAVCSK